MYHRFYYIKSFTPNCKITHLPSNWIFVFGSNLDGRHGGGAAKDAVKYFGAVWGQGEGLQGQSYAIPTMHGGADAIKPYVDRFIEFAKSHQELTFVVTPIGCGIAGHPLSEMAGLFKGAMGLTHVQLPRAFVMSVYAEESLRFGAEGHFIDNREVFPYYSFPELERADIIRTDRCDIYTIIKRGDKKGLFEYDDPQASYGEDLKLRSVGPTFGYDDILFYDNGNGYECCGYHKNYDGYVALNEKGHWTVLSLDCDQGISFICEGGSLEEVAKKVADITLLQHMTWIDPLKIIKRFEEINKNEE